MVNKNMSRKKFLFVLCLFLLVSCRNATHKNSQIKQKTNATIGNDFIDAFYSFNNDSLKTILSAAKDSWPNILYYQKWAECAHYKIVNRNDYVNRNDSTILLPVTVKDDLMAALTIDFNVTDTFNISIRNGKIRSVQTSSNDPAVYYEAKEWVKQHHPELVEKACEGIWQGGATPCLCVQGMIKGFTEFTKENKSKLSQKR